jgi:predicted  nucleic acid-binding Zn-ribbon protein
MGSKKRRQEQEETELEELQGRIEALKEQNKLLEEKLKKSETLTAKYKKEVERMAK